MECVLGALLIFVLIAMLFKFFKFLFWGVNPKRMKDYKNTEGNKLDFSIKKGGNEINWTITLSEYENQLILSKVLDLHFWDFATKEYYKEIKLD